MVTTKGGEKPPPKRKENIMNYDEQQGVAYAVRRLDDLLDAYTKEEKVPKDAIRDLIQELESEYR